MHDPVLAQVLLEQLIALNILPLRMGGRDAADQTGEMRFRLLGFEFQPLSDTGRDMFVKVTARPTGWTARPMIFGKRIWSEVLDARGRARALLFYSVGQVGLGARPPSSYIDLLPRFTIARRLDAENYPVGIDIKDAGVVVQRFGDHPGLQRDDSMASSTFSSVVQARVVVVREDFKAASAWLAERAPQHEDLLAYWGDQDIAILGLGEVAGG